MEIEPLEREADVAARQGRFDVAEAHLARLVVSRPDHVEGWLKLAAMRRALRRPALALEAVNGALRANPRMFVALLMKMSLLESLGRTAEAEQVAAIVVAQAPDAAAMPAALRMQLDRARRLDAEAAAARDARTADALEGAVLSAAEHRRVERFRSNVLRKTRHFHQEPLKFHYPGIAEIEFFDTAQFPPLAAFEAHWAEVLAELQTLLASEAAELAPYVQYDADAPLDQWKELNWSDRWSVFHLIQSGRRIEANARFCPKTLALYGDFGEPAVAGYGPNLLFSLLAPGTRIPPHTGASNCRLLFHLGLIIPDGCGFRCGATTVNWQPGRSFVFDDTIEHEAWNDSPQLRVVLIGDFWRPELSAAERDAVSRIMVAETGVL